MDDGALLPYVMVQLLVLLLVLALPGLVWQRNPIELIPTGMEPGSEDASRRLLEQQLDEQLQERSEQPNSGATGKSP